MKEKEKEIEDSSRDLPERGLPPPLGSRRECVLGKCAWEHKGVNVKLWCFWSNTRRRGIQDHLIKRTKDIEEKIRGK